jgi:hypothetical protein
MKNASFPQKEKEAFLLSMINLISYFPDEVYER